LKGPTDNTPLRSGKGYAYEGGIRVPAIVSWPGVLPEGKQSSAPISSVDYLPTICEATGTPLPDGVAIDGVSLWPHLKSGGEQPIQREAIYWHFPHYRHAPGPYSIVRAGDWKLIRWYEGQVELYNLKEDLSESDNRIQQMPEKAAQLDAMLSAELKRIGARLPRPNPEFATGK
jgi:arylsulfatase A-like enzyme